MTQIENNLDFYFLVDNLNKFISLLACFELNLKKKKEKKKGF